MNKGFQLWVTILISLFVLSACGTSQTKNDAKPKDAAPKTSEQKKGDQKVANTVYPQLSTEVSENEKLVEMETSMGSIKIKLFPEYAPA